MTEVTDNRGITYVRNTYAEHDCQTDLKPPLVASQTLADGSTYPRRSRSLRGDSKAAAPALPDTAAYRVRSAPASRMQALALTASADMRLSGINGSPASTAAARTSGATLSARRFGCGVHTWGSGVRPALCRAERLRPQPGSERKSPLLPSWGCGLG
jgi:hypothetical protein